MEWKYRDEDQDVENDHGWSSATLILNNESNQLTISAQLHEMDYEYLDIPEANIVIPLKHFHHCRKHIELAQPCSAMQVSTIEELVKGTGLPIFQLRLTSQLLFARKHLWLGFDSKLHQELWFTTMKPLISCIQQKMKKLQPESNKQIQSEVCLLAAALPSMLDNDIYESTQRADLYNAVTVDTEKSKELGLFGRYLLHLSPVAFELLNPVSESVVTSWPIRTIKKFGVHMKHLYLLIGSSCETGKGLFIFFVREHSALERQLLLISKQNSNSSVFESRLPSFLISSLSGASDTISSMGCWIRTEKFGAASKETLSSVKQASTNTEISLEATDQNSNNGTVSSSQQLDFTSPVLEENKDVAINENPSRSSLDGPTTTLPDGNSMLNNNGTLSQEIQPIYANTFSVGRPNSLGRCGIALRDKPGSKVAEEAGSMDPDSPTDLPAPPVIKRPWRMNCQFEPIEESEERISSTDSSVTLQPLTDVFPIVTSSTMEDEELVFGSMNSSGECTENEFECDEQPKFDLMSKPSNAIVRSATWNGIPDGKEWHLSNKRKEASAQTVEEEDSAEFRVLTSTKL